MPRPIWGPGDPLLAEAEHAGCDRHDDGHAQRRGERGDPPAGPATVVQPLHQNGGERIHQGEGQNRGRAGAARQHVGEQESDDDGGEADPKGLAADPPVQA